MTKKKEPIFKPASPKQALMVQRAADTQIVVIGGAAGSGKSHILNHLPLLLVDDGKTNCIFYRRTNPQLEGGLWSNGRDIWSKIRDDESLPNHIKPQTIRDQKKEIVLNNGAKIKYQQAENVQRSKDDAQGQEFTAVMIDEATQFEWEQLEYFMSRLRSPSRHFSRMIMSCNPNPDHKIRELIDWYLTDEGYADPEKDGKIRYFIKEDTTFLWGDSRQELGEKFGIPEEDWEDKILSFSFVSGLIYDNPFMLEHNKSYVAFLEGLNEIDRAQLLLGNWDIRAKGANYFERDWLQVVDSVPVGAKCCRAYDFAATERSQVNKSPDATTSCKMYKDREGYFTLAGEYHDSFIDEETAVMGRVCKRVGDRDKVVIKQAHYDGSDCVIVSPIDPAAAGKQVFTEFAKKMASEGFTVKKDPVPNNRAKLQRFLPFADAAESGLIRVAKNTFDPVTYEFIMKELEAFDGERSSGTRHDDFPDCIASAYNYLCTSKVRGRFSGSSVAGGSSKLSSYKKSIQ